MAYFDIDPLLNTMLDVAPNISDLNLSVGRPPQVEIDGKLHPVAFSGVSRLLPYHTELIVMRLLQGKRDLAEKLLKTGSAFVSPAEASVEMAEAVLRDQKRVLPCAAYLEGEYGVSGIYLGVPCQIGARGVERIFELELDKDERALLDSSIEHVKTLLAGITL